MAVYRHTPAIAGKSSISSLEKIIIGKIEQWILIRGENIDNPILLFLHGGPGNAQIGWAPQYQKELEKDFIVVNWDQRGAGLSFNEAIDPSTMNVGQFVEDARELVRLLCNRFDKQRIYVVGHSWGSIIGMHLIHKYPQLFHAYIGVGQSVNLLRGELLSYSFTLNYAKENNIENALTELISIGEPPYKDMLEDLYTQRKWLNQFGGVVYKNRDFFRNNIDTIKARPEYLEADIEKLRRGNGFSMTHMWAEVLTTNLFADIKALKVPIYFLMGEYDYNTPNSIAIEFANSIYTPHKELITFKNAAHNLPYEEPLIFAEYLRKIKEQTLKKA